MYFALIRLVVCNLLFQATISIIIAFKYCVSQSEEDHHNMVTCLTNIVQVNTGDTNLQALMSMFSEHVNKWLKIAGITNNNQLLKQNIL